MKNIEEIIEMMKKINPDIKMDDNFKKSLKNKLEVVNYAKIKNTKNKKINIAKKGIFSLKKDGKSIFEKPSFNFFKILSPIFVGAFAVFGFFNFYGQDLFILEKGGNFNYEVEKIEEVNISEEKLKVIEKKEMKNKTLKISEEKIRPVSEVKIGVQETGLEERKVENIKFIEKNEEVNLNDTLSTEGFSLLIKEDKSVNTEIIDLLGNDENIEFLKEERPVSEETFGMQETGLINLEEAVPEIYNFIKFCEDKKGIIKNDICEYGEFKCSKIDFENNKCDEK